MCACVRVCVRTDWHKNTESETESRNKRQLKKINSGCEWEVNPSPVEPLLIWPIGFSWPGLKMVWLNLPRSPTGVKAITSQKHRVTEEGRTGEKWGHPALHPSCSSSYPPSCQVKLADVLSLLCSLLCFFFVFFLIAVNDQWPSSKWAGHRRPVYQGQECQVELREACRHTHTNTLTCAILKWSLRYSFVLCHTHFVTSHYLFLFPHSLHFLHVIIVGSALTRGDIRTCGRIV